MRTLVAALVAALLVPAMMSAPAQAREWCRYDNPQQPPTGHCCEYGLTLEIFGNYIDRRSVFDINFNNTVPPEVRVNTDGGFIWLYAETNGIEGLQRGGYDSLNLRYDICVEQDLPRDYLIL